ncbi:MAG TPA: hypothetical protein VGL58_10830 [Caulobacteraceae bacterium]|jgi:hypothetical protein
MFKKERPKETRHFTHGAGGAMADAATEASPRPEDHLPGAPSAKRAKRLAPDETPDQLAEKEAASENRQEARIDESVEESFPASDPPSAHHIT